MISRAQWKSELQRALRGHRIVALIGPRQCGKTTLARSIVGAGARNYFDLDSPRSLKQLDEPMTGLEQLRGTVVIDEVQRRPELFPLLRVFADRVPLPARFLLLGSAGPELLRQTSESLAGRIIYLELTGFTLNEVGAPAMMRHWYRGGFPNAFLAPNDAAAHEWCGGFIKTFLERDVPQFGLTIPAPTLRRFWTIVAHYHGGIWNSAEAARSLAISESSARRYLDVLSHLFMVRQLQPWFENLKKRQVKSPKVYLRDTGILHALLGISSMEEVFSHPKTGASWEGYVLEEAMRILKPYQAYFWATHQGAEIDLMIMARGKRFGIEVKYQDAPGITPSMRIAMQDLGLEHITVVYPGDQPYQLDTNVSVVPMAYLARADAAKFLLPPARRVRTTIRK